MRASEFRPMVWYRVVIDCQEHIVRIDGTQFRYAIVDYYDGRIWSYGKLADYRKWIAERRQEKYDAIK